MIDVAAFARFINQPVSVARAILAQEAADLAKYPGRNVHNGFDYDKQEWVGGGV